MAMAASVPMSKRESDILKRDSNLDQSRKNQINSGPIKSDHRDVEKEDHEDEQVKDSREKAFKLYNTALDNIRKIHSGKDNNRDWKNYLFQNLICVLKVFENIEQMYNFVYDVALRYIREAGKTMCKTKTTKVIMDVVIDCWRACDITKDDTDMTTKIMDSAITVLCYISDCTPDVSYDIVNQQSFIDMLKTILTPSKWSMDTVDNITEESYFLAPCVLQQETPEEIISPKPNSQIESSPVLSYVFVGKFLPSAIFHRLVAACIAHWPIAKKKKEHREENLIFCGCCVFQLDEQYKLTLLFREYVIFLRITRMGIKDKTLSSKQCIEVREFITTNLNKIIGYLGKGLEFEYSIQCPEYNGVCINCLIPVSRLNKNPEVHCEFHDHMIESCKVLHFWFEDQVKNTDCQDTDDVDTPITQEHINHARLCNALTTVCSNALREILLTNVPTPHPDIYKAILANKAKLKLNKEQDQLVFPDPHGLSTGKVDEFDISLLYTIIRNVSSVPAPSNGWGKPPNDNPRDTTLGASVERIRIHRNHISGHSVDGKISQQEFEDYWAKIDEVLREIEIVIGNHGYLEDLEKRKNQAITPHEAHEIQKTFQEYKKQTEAAASDILSTLEKAVSDVKKLQGNQN